MPSIQVTIDKLEVSPLNVRKDRREIEDTEALAASLLAEGQLLPLIVHPMKGRKNMLGVVAGGRRYRAFKNLISAGRLPADHPIEVAVRDMTDARLVELSTTENLIRRDLRDYEVAAAVLSAHRRGRTVEELATALGQEVIWIKRQLRLGNLAPDIFAAFAADEIGLDQAAAYAATEDQALQLTVFRELQAHPHDNYRDARAIRQRLKVDDRELGRLLALVCEDRYRDAGGSFEMDLFAADAAQRGRVADECLLRQLADQALATTREELRRRTGREDLRFVTEPPKNDYGTDYSLQVLVDARKLDIDLPAGDVVCWLKPTDTGVPEPTFWWASRRAKFGTGTKGASPRERLPSNPAAAISTPSGDPALSAVRAAIKEDDGVTANGIEIFRSMRRMLLRAALIWNARVDDPDRANVGLDLLVWSQLREFSASSIAARQTGLGLIGTVHDPEIARPYLDAAPGSAVWEQARQELMASASLQEEDNAESFRLWRIARPDLKRLGAAVVAGMALDRTLNAHGYMSAVQDAVADECDVAGVGEQRLRQLFEPTPELLQLLPRDRLLDIAAPFVDSAAVDRWRRGKASELPGLVSQVLRGVSSAIDTAGKKIAARQWVHELLRFPKPNQTLAEVYAGSEMADGDELLERAAS